MKQMFITKASFLMLIIFHFYVSVPHKIRPSPFIWCSGALMCKVITAIKLVLWAFFPFLISLRLNSIFNDIFQLPRFSIKFYTHREEIKVFIKLNINIKHVAKGLCVAIAAPCLVSFTAKRIKWIYVREYFSTEKVERKK